jgi:hypothetical protein
LINLAVIFNLLLKIFKVSSYPIFACLGNIYSDLSNSIEWRCQEYSMLDTGHWKKMAQGARQNSRLKVQGSRRRSKKWNYGGQARLSYKIK